MEARANTAMLAPETPRSSTHVLHSRGSGLPSAVVASAESMRDRDEASMSGGSRQVEPGLRRQVKVGSHVKAAWSEPGSAPARTLSSDGRSGPRNFVEGQGRGLALGRTQATSAATAANVSSGPGTTPDRAGGRPPGPRRVATQRQPFPGTTRTAMDRAPAFSSLDVRPRPYGAPAHGAACKRNRGRMRRRLRGFAFGSTVVSASSLALDAVHEPPAATAQGGTIGAWGPRRVNRRSVGA